MLKRSPKLFRPLVEVEVRPEDARYGTGDESSWFSASDPIVDDLPRPLWEGLDRIERAEFVESCRNSGGVPAAAKPTEDREGEGRGETRSISSEASDFGVSAGGNRGPLSIKRFPDGTFGGKGNNGPRFRLRRGRRKRFVFAADPWPSRGELVR